jgi:hypothetical protein
MPYNKTGDILQGLALALGVVNKIRDPDKKQRDRLMQLLQTRPDLIQQYKDQDNPALAQTLAGMKPRFGPSGGYKELTDLIDKTPESPETTRNKYLRGILKDPNSPDAIEYEKTGKIRTQQEKDADALLLKTRQANLDEGVARSDIAKADAAERKAKTDRLNAARPIYAATVARLSQPDSEGKTYNNLYEAIVKGKVSGNESNSLYALDSEYNDRIKNDRQVYQDKYNEGLANQQKQLSRENQAVTNLIEDARAAGQYISAEQAQLAIRDPQTALKDKIVGPILTGLRDFNAKKVLPTAKANFIRETNGLRTDLVKSGREATDEDVQAYNNASMAAYSGTGFMPLVFGLSDVVIQKPGEKPDTVRQGIPFANRHNKQQIVIVDGDPDLIKEYKGIYSVKKEEDKKDKPDVNKAAKWETLRAKYPKKTDEEITKMVNEGKE